MKKLKQFSILLVVFLLVLFTFNCAKVQADYNPWDDSSNETEVNFKNFQESSPKKSYTLYLGEDFNFYTLFDELNFLQYDPNIEFNYSSSNSGIISFNSYKEDSVTIMYGIVAKKVGTTTITLNAKYNDVTSKKSFKIVVKGISNNPALDNTKSINDVVDIVSTSSKKTDILLANNELWSVDKNTFKLKTKSAGNVSKYVYSYVYDTKSLNIGSNIIIKFNKDKTLYVNNNKINIKNIKQVGAFTFLTSDGTMYRYDDTDTNFYTKVTTGVTKLIDDHFYIKNGKTYILSGKCLLTSEVKDAKIYPSSYSLSGNYLTKNGDLYYFYFDFEENKIVKEKIDTNVASILKANKYSYNYKTKSGQIKSWGDSTNELVGYHLSSNGSYNYLVLRTNNSLYLNDTKILTNVRNIYEGNYFEPTESSHEESSSALIVRKDGSIWRLALDGKASLTKVRSGAMSAKKISKPTKVKASKSSSNIKISYKKVAGASKYTIYRATSQNGKYTKLGTSTTASYTDKKAKTGQAYYYKIIANHSNSNYNSDYTTPVLFKIPKTPTKFKVSKKSTTSFKATYKKVSKASGYQIVYSTSKKFKNSKSVKVKESSATIKKLSKKQTYYVKIRAYQTVNGKTYYSNYTSVKKISLK